MIKFISNTKQKFNISMEVKRCLKDNAQFLINNDLISIFDACTIYELQEVLTMLELSGIDVLSKLEVAPDYLAYANQFIEFVVFPPNIRELGVRSFSRVYHLRGARFTEGSKLEFINRKAFSDNDDLEVLDLKKCVNLKLIEDWAVSGDHLKSIFLPNPNNRLTIGKNAFTNSRSGNGELIIHFNMTVKEFEEKLASKFIDWEDINRHKGSIQLIDGMV